MLENVQAPLWGGLRERVPSRSHWAESAAFDSITFLIQTDSDGPACLQGLKGPVEEKKLLQPLCPQHQMVAQLLSLGPGGLRWCLLGCQLAVKTSGLCIVKAFTHVPTAF